MEKELSDKVTKLMEYISDMPVINTRIYKSKDSKYLIHKIKIKTIKPVNYYDAIIKNKNNDFYEEGVKETDTGRGDLDDRKGLGSPSKFDLQIFQYESNYVGSTVIKY